MNSSEREFLYSQMTEDQRLAYAIRLRNDLSQLEKHKDTYLPYFKLAELIERFKNTVLNITLDILDVSAMEWFQNE